MTPSWSTPGATSFVSAWPTREVARKRENEQINVFIRIRHPPLRRVAKWHRHVDGASAWNSIAEEFGPKETCHRKELCGGGQSACAPRSGRVNQLRWFASLDAPRRHFTDGHDLALRRRHYSRGRSLAPRRGGRAADRNGLWIGGQCT